MPSWWEQPRPDAASLSSTLNSPSQPIPASGTENPYLRSSLSAYREARDRAVKSLIQSPEPTVSAPQAPQSKPIFDAGNTLSAAGTFLKQVPASLGGALAQMYVGGDRPDTYHPWARSLIDAMNRQSADNQALIDQRKAANQSDSTSESLLEASGSSGFSGASMLAGLGGFAAGSAAAGPVAGGAAAMGASGAAGYRMAEAGLLDETFKTAEAAMQAKSGRGMTEAEKADLYQKVLPIAQNTGLWEAGPEAVGNALLALGGGTALGLIGKEAVKSIAASAAKRAGVKLASGLAGVGSEVATEGVTQYHQGNDQARVDAVLAGQSPDEAKPVYEGAAGLWQATKDVAPQTLALVGMMGLGAKAAHVAARPIQQRIEGKAAGSAAIEQADLARAALHDMDEAQLDAVVNQTRKALTDYPQMPKSTRAQLTAGLESLAADQQARTNGDAFRAAMASPNAMQTLRGQSAVLGMADPARVSQLSDGEVEAASKLADELSRSSDAGADRKTAFTQAAQRYQAALQTRRTMAGMDDAIKNDATVIPTVIRAIQQAAFGSRKEGITPEYARAALDDGELSRHLTAIESLLDRHGDKVGEKRAEILSKARDALMAEREHRATQPDWQQQNAAVRAANDPAEVRFRSTFAQEPEKAIAKLTSEHLPLIDSLMQSLQTRIGNIEKTGYSAPEELTKPLALLQGRKVTLEAAAQPSPTPTQPPVTQSVPQPAQQQPTTPITSLADALRVTPTGDDPLAELIAQQQPEPAPPATATPRPVPSLRSRPVVSGRESKGTQSLVDLLNFPSAQGAVASSPSVAQGPIATPVALGPRPKLTQEEIKARQGKSSSAQQPLPQQQKIAQHPADDYKNWNALTDEQVKAFAKAMRIKPKQAREATLNAIDDARQGDNIRKAWDAAIPPTPPFSEPTLSQPQPTGDSYEKGKTKTEAVLSEASPPANTEAGKDLQATVSETPKDAPSLSAPVQTPAGVGKATRVGRGVTAIELPVGAAATESEKSKPSAQEKPVADNIPPVRFPSFVRENIERHFASGKGFKSITEARALIADIAGKKVNPGTQEAKQADEWIEQAIVRRARDIAQTNAGLDWSDTFRLMTELYDQQPSLNVRTSTSVAHQAYSTPAPLAFLASRIAGVTLDTQSVVVEPTAGNGMLLMEALPKQAQANELNKDRAEFLKALGFATDERDATQWLPSKKADILIANPPFGTIKDDSRDRKTWRVPSSVAPNGEYETGEIDHAIVLKQLANLKDDGSAVLIVGGVNAPTEKSRALKYNAGAKRDFYWTLYNDYNVVDQFTIDGSLYAKQGASFPVDVIVIRGRGKSSLNVPAVNAPRIYTSWESIYEELFNDRISVWVPSRRISGDASGNVADAKEISGSSRGEAPAVDRPSAGNGRASTEGLAGNVPDAAGFGADLPELDVSRKGNRRSVGERGLSNGSDAGNQAEREPRSGTDTPRRPASGADGKTGVVAQRGDRAALKASGWQTTYRPESKQNAIGTLVPSNMATSVSAALKSLKERVGDLDDYVARELDYPPRELGRYFAAEQIDALALAIDNIANNKGFIIGDQTGIGKGRVNAGVMRWALQHGKTPIFVTEKPNLYRDMIRDLTDIGIGEGETQAAKVQSVLNKVFMTNSDEQIPLDDEAMDWYARASTPVSLEANLKVLGDDKTVQALLDNGRLKLVARQSELPSSVSVPTGERVAGAVDPKTGQVYLVAENIRPEDVTGFLTHEVGVHQTQLGLNQPKSAILRLAHAMARLVGARQMLGEASFNDVLAQLERMRAAGHTGVKAAFAQAEEAMKALDQNPALLREEALAYLVQQRPNLPLVKRIIAAVRAFLYRAGFRVNLTENDVRALAASALRGAARENAGAVGKVSEGAMSASAMKSVNANIRRGKEALTKALLEKTSVHRAMFRTGMGWVDFVWGREGRITSSGKTKGAMGLAHILEARQRKDGVDYKKAIDLLDGVVETIAKGQEFSRREIDRSIRVGIEHADTIAWLAKQPGSNAWVVTGYEKNPDGRLVGRATERPTHDAASLTRNVMGAELKPGATSVGNGTTRAIQNTPTPTQGTPGASFNNSIPPSSEKTRFARAYTADQEAAMDKIGKRPPKSWTERFAEVKDRFGLKLRKAVADQYASLLALDQQAYGNDIVEQNAATSSWVKARLSRSVDGPMNLLLHEAALKMDADGALDVIAGSKGLQQILEPLGPEADDFLKWVAGWRADRLKKEDRERLFTDADIKALKALNQGAMADGRSRSAVYGKALREFSALQKSVMDIAQQAGLIDEDERNAWERDFYVPFYRLAEDSQDARTIHAGDGLTRQEAFKRLKGGKDRLNDLLENTVMNWHHLLSASLKNAAARQALTNAQLVRYDGIPVAEKINPNKESTKGAVFYRKNGKEQWLRVNDPLVLEAVTALDFSGLKGPVMNVLRKARHILTRTTTMSPAFKAANLIRDTVQTLAVSKVSAKTAGLGNIKQGWNNYAADSAIRRSLLAGGGAFRFGSSLEDNAEALRKLLTKGVRPETILDTPKKLFDVLSRAYWKWEDLGDRLENVNRAALYTQLREQGKSHLYASFQARDLLDFSQSGASGAVRFLTAVVPFLNARIQGLDKLGRAASQPAQRGRFAVTLAATTLASTLLYLLFKDDPDFKEREEWDRDTYWWFKIPGIETPFRIPKPFEIGALATLLGDRVVEQMADKEANSKLYLDRLKFTLTQTFAISGPQLLMPVLNVWANKNPFTERSIETQAQQKLSPELRQTARTSDTARVLSKASGGFVSPIQADYLIGAYFGWLGRQAVLMADYATRPLTDRRVPERIPVVGDLIQRFMPTEKTGSKYLTRFYEAAATAERHYADIRELLRRDEKEAARILLQSHADEIGRLKAYRAAGAELNDWNHQLKMLADLPASKISDEQRTAMQDRLQKAKLHLARALMEGRAVD